MDTTSTSVLASKRVEKLAALFLLVASVFVALLGIDRLMGFFEPRESVASTITVAGEGKVTAIPDIATVSFTVSEDGDNASAAQDATEKKINVAVALLKDLGIEEKDIKTTSYSISPKYAYQQPCYTQFCPPVNPRIVGYTTAQTIEVKVRKTEDAGKALSSLGDAGVTNLYGPNFTIDDIEGVRDDAREAAIDAARAKARVLARDLGVSLVRIVAFYENGGPVYYYGKGLESAMDSVAPVANPTVPAGENEIIVNVTVTYEIR